MLIGACLGFLPLNWSPAKLFMGDSGALVLGLLMATSAIAITGQLDPAMLDPERVRPLAAARCLHPDPAAARSSCCCRCSTSASAVLRRMSAGKSPFSPDRKHLHHRMLDMGHSDRDAVLIFYAWTAVICSPCC